MNQTVCWELLPYSFSQLNPWLFDHEFGWLEYCIYPRIPLFSAEGMEELDWDAGG